MMYHFGPDYFSGTPSLQWLWFGDYGPHIFFMISGLVIGLLSGKNVSPQSFLKRRYDRLIPTYWAALTLTTIILTLFSLSGEHPSVTDYLANITLAHKIFGVEHVDLVYWTLLVEITFYLLFSFLILPVKRIDFQVAILGLWLVLSYVYLASLVAQVELPLVLSALKQVLILQHAPFFIIGLAMAYVHRGYTTNALLLLVVGCYLHIWLMYPASRAAYLSGSFVIFSALVFYPSPILSSKYLQLLGWLSYPLYLIHREIGFIVIGRFEVLGYPVLGCLFAVFISLVLAYCFALYFDRSSRPTCSSGV